MKSFPSKDKYVVHRDKKNIDSRKILLINKLLQIIIIVILLPIMICNKINIDININNGNDYYKKNHQINLYKKNIFIRSNNIFIMIALKL